MLYVAGFGSLVLLWICVSVSSKTLVCSFLVLSLSGVDIRIMQALENESGNVPSGKYPGENIMA